MPPPSRATLLILDWDSTLTTASTLPFLASASTYPKMHPVFEEASRRYVEDLKVYKGGGSEDGRTGSGWVGERGVLETIKPIEEASLARVKASGIFAGVTPETLRNLARRCVKDHNVVLRPGWKELIENTQASGSAHRTGEVHIVSVGWSEVFIQACLEVEGGRRMVEERGEGFVGVFANEVDGTGTGSVVAGAEGEGLILTSGDKERVVRGLEKSYREQWKGSSVAVVSVYVGDSVTDLGALMACDAGICVRDGEGQQSGEQMELRETLERIGVEVRWIGEMKAGDLEGLEERRIEDEEKKVIWWAKGLEEVVKSPLYDDGPR